MILLNAPLETNFSEILIANRNWIIFIQENAFENIVCEMAAILSRGRWVNENSIGNKVWISNNKRMK